MQTKLTTSRGISERGNWRIAVRKAALAIGLIMTAAHVLGLGVRIPNQDPEAISRGNAFVATADNPSAIYYNPAGISQIPGQEIHIGALLYLDIDASYESPDGTHVKNHREVIPVPNIQYTIALPDQHLSLGLGVYAPFGLGMEWPDTAPFRNAGVQGKITYLTANPVIAWKPFSSLAIAAGPTLNYSQAKMRRGVAVSPYELHLDGDDWDYGYNAGILWQPLPQLSFGAKYFSATSMEYSGKAIFRPSAPFLPPDMSTTTSLKFPQMACVGVSYRPTTNWNFEVDVDWTDWSRTKELVIKNLGTLPLNWHQSFFYEVGGTRQLGGGYFVSLGYFFSEASTSETDYTPLVPDTDLHVGSLGFGRRGARWDWAVATQIIGGSSRTVAKAADPTVDGKYKLFTPTLSFSLGYHF